MQIVDLDLTNRGSLGTNRVCERDAAYLQSLEKILESGLSADELLHELEELLDRDEGLGA